VQVGALLYLLKEVVGADEQTIVFASTRHHVSFLGQLLQADGLQCSLVYGEMDQTARNISVAKFGARKSKVQCVADVPPTPHQLLLSRQRTDGVDRTAPAK
jgi:ATP-dependent RNA helicase DDX54/DBP10